MSVSDLLLVLSMWLWAGWLTLGGHDDTRTRDGDISGRTILVIVFLAGVPLALLTAGFLIFGVPPQPSVRYCILQVFLAAATILFGRQAVADRDLFGRAAVLMQLLVCCACPALMVWDTNRAAAESFSRLPPARVIPAKEFRQDPSFIPVVAHISDLHVVGPGVRRTRDGDYPGNDSLPRLLLAIRATGVRYLAASGDITDSGSASEWKAARDLLRGSRPVILAPGNHDLSAALERDPDPECRRAGVYHALLHVRRFLESSSDLGPSMSCDGRPVASILRAAPQPPKTNRLDLARKRLDECEEDKLNYVADGDRMKVRPYVARQCEHDFPAHTRVLEEYGRSVLQWQSVESSIFPLSVLDRGRGLAFFILSTRPEAGDLLGENAIGRIEPGQVSRLARSVETLPPDITHVIIVCHHPLVRHEGETLRFDIAHPTQSEWWGYAFLRADTKEALDAVLAIDGLAKRQENRSFLVLYGHRHATHCLSIHGRTLFAEAPNVSGHDRGAFLVGLSGSGFDVRWMPVP